MLFAEKTHVFFHNAPIPDSLDAMLLCFISCFFVVDSFLHPHDLHAFSYCVSDDRQNILGGSEDIYYVNRLVNRQQVWVAFRSQYLGCSRVHRKDIVSVIQQILGNVVSWFRRISRCANNCYVSQPQDLPKLLIVYSISLFDQAYSSVLDWITV